MKARNIIIGIVVIGVVAVAGVLGYIWFAGGNNQASVPISAPEVEAAAGAVTFSIVPDESEVRFLLDEDLRGERITVTGSTTQVAGEIAVDFAVPANSSAGVIRINARTLETDNEFRNRAIRSAILRSSDDAYEFIEFTPTALTGLPETVTIGEAFTFQIMGDLKILDITQPVTFDVTVTPESETRLVGAATAVITREAYGLTIPSAPGVANVEEEVEIQLDFVATASAAA